MHKHPFLTHAILTIITDLGLNSMQLYFFHLMPGCQWSCYPFSHWDQASTIGYFHHVTLTVGMQEAEGRTNWNNCMGELGLALEEACAAFFHMWMVNAHAGGQS